MRHVVSTLRLVGLVVLLAAPTLAQATPPFQALPTLDGTPTRLQVRVLKYTGGTNGEMVVEVHNPSTRTEVFAAQGLYFVPDGDPEKAPQRLGAAGPFQVVEQGQQRRLERLELKPNTQTVLRKHQGNVPAAKAEIQSGVWHARDSKWLKLDGERRQEKAPRQESGQQQRRQRIEQQEQRVAP